MRQPLFLFNKETAYYEECDGILVYSYDNGATWTEMTNAATDHFTYAPSTNLTHNSNTTSQMTGTTGTFFPGKVISGLPDANSWASVNDGGRMEYEWVLKPNTNTLPGKTYIFELYYYMDYPLNTPTLHTGCVNVELVSATGDTRCGSGTLLLNAVPRNGVSVRWKDKNGNILGTGNSFTTPVLTVTDTFYAEPYVTYGNNQSCSGTPMQVIATVQPGADVNLGNDTSLCIGDTLVLVADDPFYVSWKWSDNSTGNSLTIKQGGKYWLEVLTQTGCKLSDTIEVVAFEKPIVNLPNNLDTCLSDGELLTLDAGNPGAHYLWDNNYNGRIRVVDRSGTYHVTVTSANGCKTIDTSIINIKPNPKSLLPDDTTICEDATIILDPGPDGISYYWSNGVNTRTNKIEDAGDYIVFITARNGCVLSDTITVIESGSMPKYDRLQIKNIGPKTFKFEITNPQFVTGYHWDFGDGSPIVYQQSPTYTYQVNGNYLVKGYVTSSCGIYYDTMSVHIYSMGVNNLGEESITLYPNPVDDYLNLALTKSPENLNLNIYDLLGKKVYSSNLLDNQNQYKIDLRELPEGQYVVILKEDNMILKKAKILIIR